MNQRKQNRMASTAVSRVVRGGSIDALKPMGTIAVALLSSALKDTGNLVISNGLRSCFRGVYCQPLTGVCPRPVHRVGYREVVHHVQEDFLQDAALSHSSCIFSHV